MNSVTLHTKNESNYRKGFQIGNWIVFKMKLWENCGNAITTKILFVMNNHIKTFRIT